MPKSKNQKLKLLYIKDLLESNTDNKHGVTLNEIISHLASNGIDAERKSLYDDIELLRDVYGMEIQRQKIAKRVEYRLTERKFDLHELKLLGDAVQSSRFVTEKKSTELIGKLKSECSRYEADKLSRQVLVSGRVKSMNESIYFNIDTVFDAIASEKCITFKYYSYTFDKQKKFHRDGSLYQVSPYALTYSNENYYLIAHDFESDELRHYRVDRMYGIELCDRARDADRLFGKIDVARYTDMHFGMFGGEVQRLRIEFDQRLASAVFDRFGIDTVALDVGGGRYEVFVAVAVSEQFFGWLSGLGPAAKIKSPEKVKADYIEFLRKLLENANS